MKLARTLCLFVVMAGLALAQQAAEKTELTIPAIFSGAGLTGRAPEALKWSPDGAKVSFVQRDDSGERGELWYVDVASGNKAVLVAAEKLASLAPPSSRIKDERVKENRQRYSVAAYNWAPDSKHLLFDSMGQLWLYSLDTGTAVQLTSAPDPSSDPKFSPDGTRIAYVRKHNLFVRPVAGGKEKQLTSDGSDDLLNGEVDWVYAEELDVRSNYFWSPNGKQIVLLQMDEKPVPTYPITDWIPTRAKVEPEKYPKAGDPNPAVRLGVLDSDGGKVKWITVGQEKDFYIPRFGWVRDGLLWAQVLNRAQNKLDLYFVDAKSGRARLMLSDSQPDAWIEMSDDFRISRSGHSFVWPSWRDGHTHLYLYTFDAANPLASGAKLDLQLTSGDFEVKDLLAEDDATGDTYFTANEGDPREQHIYRRPGGRDTRSERISQEPGTHNAKFAPRGLYYTDNYSSLMTPPRLMLCKVGGACNTIWQSRSVDPLKLIAPKFVDFKAEDGTTLYGLLLLPPQAAQLGAKVPLILNPYGGPHGQNVRNSWGGSNFLFHEILARRGFAILQVDNRGMGARGKKFALALKRNFGEIELKDQLAALEQALKMFPALDRDRVGFWGWSYGGYMTTYAMTHSDAFKAGVAVAPVTDWHDYDTIYTERYMGLPKDNLEGYRKSSPVNAASGLRGSLLLVHGTGDDNVHVQNTMQMVNSLTNAGKQYNLLLYPRKTHGIAGAPARTHLFTRIQQHFEENLLAPQVSAATAAASK